MILTFSYIIFLLFAFISHSYEAVTSCNATTDTFYDGFLSSSIYFAAFNKTLNSNFKFSNPYYGVTPISATTVSFWAKHPLVSTDGSLQSGRLLDCSDIMYAKLINDTVRWEVSVNQNAFTSGSGLLDAKAFSSSLSQLKSWNNYVMVYSKGVQTIYVNSVSVATQTITLTTLSTTSQYCYVGNSVASDDPSSVYMRHLYFTNTAWTSSTVDTLAHHVKTPTNKDRLAYFKFSMSAMSNDMLYYDATKVYTYTNVAIKNETEAEFVCYCEGTIPNFMNITTDFILKPINFTSMFSTNIDSNGFGFDFYTYFQKNINSDLEQTLFEINNYARIVLTNNSNTLRIDVLNNTGSVTSSVTFTSYNVIYNFWVLHQIKIIKKSQMIYVNGELLDSQTNTITFATTKPDTLNIKSPVSISYQVANITLKNYRLAFVGFLDLTQSNLTSAYLQASTGTIKYAYNNQLCDSAVSNVTTYWNGKNCKDNRLFNYFNQNKLTGTLMKNTMISSLSNMTIEIWLKDMNAGASSTSVIFENTLDSSNALIQISLTTGTTTSASRTLTCGPILNVFSTKTVQITGLSTYKNWVHFSCQSNVDLNQVQTYAYSASTAKESTTILSGIAFTQQTSPIVTTLGASVTGSNQFQGYLRELRFWSLPLGQYYTSIYRFQAIRSSSHLYGTKLIYYYLMDDQITPYNLVDVSSNLLNFQEQSSTLNAVSLVNEQDLVICQPGLYYTGQCCSSFSIAKGSFNFTYSTSLNFFQVQLNQGTMDSFTFNSLKANFSIASVGNNFYYSPNQWYTDYLSQYFNVNQTASFTVSTNLVLPYAYNITLQALIYSDLLPEQYITVYQTLTLTCPMIWLTIVPNYITDSVQYVSSSSTELRPKINANVINTCYNPTTKATYTATTSNISWKSNVTTGFSTLFTTSSDFKTLTAVSSKTITSTNTYQLITASMTVSKVTYSNSIAIQFIDQKIVNTAYPTQSVSLSKVQGDSLTLDLSGASIYPSSTTNIIKYSVTCPTTIFYTTDSYNSLCQISSTGVFKIGDTAKLYVVADYPYYFEALMNINGTSILSSVLATIKFTKNGGTSDCPRVDIQTSFLFYINQTTPLQILPDPYLSCNGVSYDAQSVNWTVQDSRSKANLNSILSFGTQTIYRFANITPELYASNNIVSGQVLNVTIAFTISSSITKYASSQVIFSQNLLQPVVKMYGKWSKTYSTYVVPFTEQLVIFNASSSYDPDSLATTNFQYDWVCPTIVSQYYQCEQFYKGSTNQFLQINALQRQKIGFSYNTVYNFTLKMSSNANPYKTQVSLTFQVKFSPPSSSDSSGSMNTTCIKVSASGGKLYNDLISKVSQKIMKYDISNYTQTWFNIDTTNDMTCNGTTINEQNMYVYLFDTGFFNGYQPVQWIFGQNQSSSISNQFSLKTNMSDKFNMISPNITVATFIQMNVYYFTTRNSDTETVYLSMDTIYIMRNKAALVASIASPQITVDKYTTLVIDASSSYDPDQLNLNYTYTWTCPNTTVCSGQNTSILTLTTSQRSQSNFNTKGTIYQFSVIMSDGSRQSAMATANVTITMNSTYSNCISVAMLTQELNALSSDNTIYLQYNQMAPIDINMTVKQLCDAVNYGKVAFQISNGESSKSLLPWQTDSLSAYVIYFYNALFMNYMTPGKSYSINFSQTFTMGLDKTIDYSQTYTFQIMMSMPSIVISISGPQIVQFNDTITSFTLNANQSYDPAGNALTYNWDCPTYFSTSACSTSSSLTLDQATIKTKAIASAGSLEYYYGKAHGFNLTITSIDGRSTSYTQYVFLSSSSSTIDNTYINCGIKPYSTTNVLGYQKIGKFYFGCDTSTLTSAMLTNQTLTWSVPLLSKNLDYFQNGQDLQINSYVGNKLASTIDTISIYVTFSPLNASFSLNYKLKNNQLTQGLVSLDSTSQYAYGYQYNLSVSSFTSTGSYGIQSQLRRHTGSCDIIALPIKPYNANYTAIQYQNMILPSSSSSLFIDFFDMNFQYMGSYNLTQQSLNVSSTNVTSTQYLALLQTITNKSSSSYVRYNNFSYAQFEKDLYQLEVLSEALLLSIINDTTTSYVVSIINYIISTNNVLTVYYTPSYSYYQEQAYYNLMKKQTQILSSVLQTNITINDLPTTKSIVNMLDVINSYYTTITGYGNDQAIFRYNLIESLQVMYKQIVANGYTANTVYNVTKNALNQLIMSKTSKLSQGDVSSTVQGTQNVQLLLVNTTGADKTIASTFNTKDQLLISDQSTLYSAYNISVLEVTFTFQTNASAATSTMMDINAYDANSLALSIDFTSSSSSSTTNVSSSLYERFFLRRKLASTTSNALMIIDISVKDEYVTKFNENETSSDGLTSTQYIPYCVYYDRINSVWSTNGVSTLSYDNTTGVVRCQTDHLSTFSIDYYTVSTQIGTVTSDSDYYFPNQPIAYYIIVGCTIFIALLAVIFTLIKPQTMWDYNAPKIVGVRNTYSFCQILGSAFLLYHPIVSALIGPTRANINTTQTKVNKMLNLLLTFYALCFVVLILFYVYPDYDWDPKWRTALIFGAIIAGGAIVIRPIFITLSFIIYFIGTSEPEKSASSSKKSTKSTTSEKRRKKKTKSNKAEEESLLSGGASSMKMGSITSKKSSNSRTKKLRDKYSFEMEGGSSEEEDDFAKFRKQKKKQQTGRNPLSDRMDNQSNQQKKAPPQINKNRYDVFTEESVTSKQKPQHRSKNSRQDVGYTYAINESSDGNSLRGSKQNQDYLKEEKKKKKRRAPNESHVKASSPGKDSDLELPKKRGGDQSSVANSMKSKRSQFKERGVKKDGYGSSSYKSDEEYGKISKKKGTSSVASSVINKQIKDQGALSSRMGSQASVYKEGNRKGGMGSDNEKSMKRRNKTKGVEPNLLTEDLDSAQKSRRGKRDLEDTISPQYTAWNIIITVGKLLVMLGFLAVNLWLMRFLKDFDAVQLWLEVFIGAFLALVIVIDTLFIFVFALFFKCCGPNICSRISATILLGNAHSNCVNALVYDLTNKQ